MGRTPFITHPGKRIAMYITGLRSCWAWKSYSTNSCHCLVQSAYPGSWEYSAKPASDIAASYHRPAPGTRQSQLLTESTASIPVATCTWHQHNWNWGTNISPLRTNYTIHQGLGTPTILKSLDQPHLGHPSPHVIPKRLIQFLLQLWVFSRKILWLWTFSREDTVSANL